LPYQAAVFQSHKYDTERLLKIKHPMRTHLTNIYQRLYHHFGPQGWWPTTPPNGDRPRYVPDRPGRSLTPSEQWEIVVGAILTQNTAWRNVEYALAALHAQQKLDLYALAALAPKTLGALIRPSGYFNQKAQRLLYLAQYLIHHAGGDIAAYLKRPGTTLRSELLALKGVGPETADAILLYAGHHLFFVIDAYTRRILSRLGVADLGADYDAWQRLFMDNLPPDAVLFNQYHALLVQHAVTYCRVKPRCAACCLKAQCPYPNNFEGESA
jgi:endonuclease-3 related protein